MNPTLSPREKLLYHQIHPLKLAVDFSTSFVSTWLFWRHELVLGLLVAWVPSVLATVAMLRWMDFTRERDSQLGSYIARHMTRLAEAVRFGGQFMAWFGAWFFAGWLVVLGYAIVVVGWTYSLLSRRRVQGPDTRA
jgi:hypothetical protein